MVLPTLRPSNFLIFRRHFRKWINSIFNQVDHQRIKDVGPDRAAAEWLLRCGASVKWQDDHQWIKDYNELPKICDNKEKIVEIDATDSCIMHTGFFYLEGLQLVKKIKFCKCIYLEDRCMQELSVVKNSLESLDVISCGNVTDSGVYALSELKLLKNLYLYDLPEVKNKEKCLSELMQNLPHCKISFPSAKE